MSDHNEYSTPDAAVLARRWLPLVGGGALVLLGLARRRSAGDAALVVAGGALAGRALLEQMQGEAIPAQPAKRGENQVSVPHKQGIRVDKAFTIGVPRQELYAFWRDLSNLPNFMHHLQRVEVLDDVRSHWTASAPAGQTVEWDAEIINDKPGELLAWRSTEGAQIANAGTVSFKDAPGGRGTELRVELLYDAPGGFVGSALAKVFGEEPAQQVENDLRRLKQLLEAGEVATTEGQSTGSRSQPGISIGPRIS